MEMPISASRLVCIEVWLRKCKCRGKMGGGVSRREDGCVARRNEGISLRGGRRKRCRRRGEAERVSVTFCGNDGHRSITTTGGINSLLFVHVAAGLATSIGHVAVGFRDGLGQNNYT